MRGGVRLAQSEIAELASSWDIEAAPNLRSPRLVPEQHWPDIVREAPLPALIVAFLMGVLVARRQPSLRLPRSDKSSAQGDWLAGLDPPVNATCVNVRT
ncbi:hypothetical protein [Bradyrhizobium symbiodeficiens]|uniref:Uncharacterized protein n=1 Tax=Bradyrhizobium symbiodeficiens TaxID=1404367 RepID=A0AAJ6MLE9_9BRAD|nr:hypothetical protein [Bradyrhizobium symbiodeficiens]